jgi:hypothetical protein
MRRTTLSLVPIGLGLLALAGCNQASVDAQPEAPKVIAPAPPRPARANPAGDEDGGMAVPGQVTDKYRNFVAPKREPKELTLVSIPITAAPVVDGRASEDFWSSAPAITTLDFSSQRPITLRAAHTRGEVFFLVTFPEEFPHETHKTWTWDPKEEVYREGPDREDVFIFKWSMSGNDVDLRLREPMPHKADIWFWKAHRSNPSGYADDKGQGISTKPTPMARKLQSSKYGTLYFDRWGDTGKPPWDHNMFFEHKGDKLDQFAPREPSGSRGDVRAKGVWHKGQWTIEFARKLVTGHDDDVAFAPDRAFLFAVGCYAMAMDTPHQEWSRPLYRTGDAFDRLFLSFGNAR